jgi:hypothetical protein
MIGALKYKILALKSIFEVKPPPGEGRVEGGYASFVLAFPQWEGGTKASPDTPAQNSDAPSQLRDVVGLVEGAYNSPLPVTFLLSRRAL